MSFQFSPHEIRPHHMPWYCLKERVFQFSPHEIPVSVAVNFAVAEDTFNSLLMRFPGSASRCRRRAPRFFQFSPHEIRRGAVADELDGHGQAFNSLLMRFSARRPARSSATGSFQFSPHEIQEEGGAGVAGGSRVFQFSPHEIQSGRSPSSCTPP